MEILVGLLGSLIGAFLTAKYAERDKRRLQFRALAYFLEKIAGCLERMEKSLRNDVAPTVDGKNLENIVGEFADLIQGAPLDSKWKKEAELLRIELETHLHSGEVLDDITLGYVLQAPAETKANLLHGMVQTAGRLRSQAYILRVKANMF